VKPELSRGHIYDKTANTNDVLIFLSVVTYPTITVCPDSTTVDTVHGEMRKVH